MAYLTPGEKAVLTALKERGLTNAEIAEKTGLSPRGLSQTLKRLQSRVLIYRDANDRTYHLYPAAAEASFFQLVVEMVADERVFKDYPSMRYLDNPEPRRDEGLAFMNVDRRFLDYLISDKKLLGALSRARELQSKAWGRFKAANPKIADEYRGRGSPAGLILLSSDTVDFVAANVRKIADYYVSNSEIDSILGPSGDIETK